MSTQKKGLGRGLSALIPSAAESKVETRGARATLEVAVDRITPSPFQPRRSFDEAKIEELAASIRNQGIIQPLVVRPRGDGFELIAGEREQSHNYGGRTVFGWAHTTAAQPQLGGNVTDKFRRDVRRRY